MGKVKKGKLNPHAKNAFQKHRNPASKPSLKKPAKPAKSTKNKQQSAPPAPLPTIPFSPEDRILLIGEGDFSFAHSLLIHHACHCICATTYENQANLLSKHPQAAAHISALCASDQKVLYGVDATKLGNRIAGASGGGKPIRRQPWDRIIFNFPHVGGLTKDVNRQVRANQSLLVGFFTAALPLLAPRGTIIVTIFEGEPYDLWNVRDLGRHAGLTVQRSFRFQAGAYPGYKHARTLGNLEGGRGWRGEDRSARTYIIEAKESQEEGLGGQAAQKKKRSREDSTDDDDDDNAD